MRCCSPSFYIRIKETHEDSKTSLPTLNIFHSLSTPVLYTNEKELLRTHRKEFMNEKDIKTKSDKEDSEDFDEDIPFSENWKRETVESMKQTLCSWLDHNLEHESATNYDIYSKENETRLYVKVHEENSEDPENEVDQYYCIFNKYDTREVEETDVNFQ